MVFSPSSIDWADEVDSFSEESGSMFGLSLRSRRVSPAPSSPEAESDSSVFVDSTDESSDDYLPEFRASEEVARVRHEVSFWRAAKDLRLSWQARRIESRRCHCWLGTRSCSLSSTSVKSK